MWSGVLLWFLFAFPWWLVMLATCMSSLEKWLFRSSAHFKIRLFSYRVVWVFHIFWIWFANIFPIQYIGFSFCWWLALANWKLLFDVVPLVYFCLYCCFYFAVKSKKSSPSPSSRTLPPKFSSNVIVSGLTLMTLFWVILSVWYVLFLYKQLSSTFPNTAYWRHCPFPIVYSQLLS